MSFPTTPFQEDIWAKWEGEEQYPDHNGDPSLHLLFILDFGIFKRKAPKMPLTLKKCFSDSSGPFAMPLRTG